MERAQGKEDKTSFYVPIDSIYVPENRQRKERSEAKQEQLKFSMDQYGLLHPLVVSELKPPRQHLKWELIAGETRLISAEELGWQEIEVKNYGTLTLLEKKEIELEENIQRQNYNWKEEADAIRELFELKKEQYSKSLPGRFVRPYTQDEYAKDIKVSPAKVSQAIKLSRGCEEYPQLSNIPTLNQAIRQHRRLKSGGSLEDSAYVVKMRELFAHANPLEACEKIENSAVDLLITDVSEILKNNTDILEARFLFEEFKRILHPTANAFVFLNMEHLIAIGTILKELGLIYNPKPYLWHLIGKDDYRGFLWFSRNLREYPTYVKQLLPHRPDTDTLHSLAKPYSLLADLVKCTTLQKALVVDPICYSPNIIKVCIDQERYVKAFCPNKILCEQYLINIREDGSKNE